MAGWCGGEVGQVFIRTRGEDGGAASLAGAERRRGTNRLQLLLVALFSLLAVGAAGEVKARFKTVEILVTEYQPEWEDEASHCGQDALVLDVLGKAPGYFIELGAHDGFHFSNTRVLEQDFNWTGLCIEPNHRNIFKLAHREGCRVMSALVADQDGDMVDFKVFEDEGEELPGPSSLSGIVRPDTDNAHRPGGNIVRMPTITLGTILRETKAPRVIDYLSLDVEGAEHLVLAGIPHNDFVFSVVTIERPLRAAILILNTNGYRYLKALGGYGEDAWLHQSTPRFVFFMRREGKAAMAWAKLLGVAEPSLRLAAAKSTLVNFPALAARLPLGRGSSTLGEETDQLRGVVVAGVRGAAGGQGGGCGASELLEDSRLQVQELRAPGGAEGGRAWMEGGVVRTLLPRLSEESESAWAGGVEAAVLAVTFLAEQACLLALSLSLSHSLSLFLLKLVYGVYLVMYDSG